MGWKLKIKTQPSGFLTFTVVIAALPALVDALLFHFGDNGRISYYQPPETLLLIASTWISFVLIAALIFSLPVLRRISVAGVLMAGPGLLYVAKAETYFRSTDVTTNSVKIVTIEGLIAVAVVAVIQFFVRFDARVTVSRVALAACGVGFFLFIAFGSSNISTVGPGPSGKGRNVVLVILDTTRFDALDVMPNLERLRMQSASFDNAWSVASWTMPSHFTMFTGIEPWASVDYDQDLVAFRFTNPTLADRLTARGYASAAIFANPFLSPGSGLTKGFTEVRYTGSCGACRSTLMYVVQRICIRFGTRNPICDAMTASEVVRTASTFIDRTRRPYFLTLNFMDSHFPYYLEADCRAPGQSGYLPPDDRAMLYQAVSSRSTSPLPAGVTERLRGHYYGIARCLDRSLGRLFDDIDRQPDAGRTVIAVVADHGEQLGEHGLYDHGNSVYRQLLHVPLIIKGPGIAPQHITEPVSTLDLYATLLQLSKAAPVARPTLFTAHRPFCASNCGVGWFSVADAHYHVISPKVFPLKLFDYTADPNEIKPLPTDSPQVAELLQAARQQWAIAPRGGANLKALPYLQ